MTAYADTMKLWIDSAKACSQLAIAAMFLPVFFIRELIGVGQEKPLSSAQDESFVSSWIAFILAIVLSHTYQITATKLIATNGKLNVWLFPRAQYWSMLASLVIGLAFFVRGAVHSPLAATSSVDCSHQAPQVRTTNSLTSAPV